MINRVIVIYKESGFLSIFAAIINFILSRIFGVRVSKSNGKNEGRGLEEILAEFLTIRPCEQNAFELFPNSWSTQFENVDTSGSFNGTQDPRIDWLQKMLTSIGNRFWS